MISEDDGGRVAVSIYENGYGYDHDHARVPASESCDCGARRTCWIDLDTARWSGGGCNGEDQD
jgi:hypothetical protein